MVITQEELQFRIGLTHNRLMFARHQDTKDYLEGSLLELQEQYLDRYGKFYDGFKTSEIDRDGRGVE